MHRPTLMSMRCLLVGFMSVAGTRFGERRHQEPKEFLLTNFIQFPISIHIMHEHTHTQTRMLSHADGERIAGWKSIHTHCISSENVEFLYSADAWNSRLLHANMKHILWFGIYSNVLQVINEYWTWSLYVRVRLDAYYSIDSRRRWEPSFVAAWRLW